MKSYIVVGLCAAMACTLVGCATKRYDRMQPLSSIEVSEYSCRELAIEAAKCEEALYQVAEGAQIDGASVLGILGDFGIGNAMERSKAEKSIRERLRSVRDAQAAKGCLPADVTN